MYMVGEENKRFQFWGEIIQYPSRADIQLNVTTYTKQSPYDDIKQKPGNIGPETQSPKHRAINACRGLSVHSLTYAYQTCRM